MGEMNYKVPKAQKDFKSIVLIDTYTLPQHIHTYLWPVHKVDEPATF